jgi:serine/threonine protein kinase
VLLAVARSLSYLHGMSLLHGDVKLDNVLLKSEPARPLGITPKVRGGFCFRRVQQLRAAAVGHPLSVNLGRAPGTRARVLYRPRLFSSDLDQPP